MAKVEIIELLIDETKEEMGINAVSVVESPAIEENFIALQKHEVELKEVDTEKRILMGAALIPNKQIYRKNKDKEFYIYFSEDTVRKASELFLMRSNQNNATYEHERKMLEGMSVVESWIIEDEKTDKSRLYNFNLPKGTWMISMKVNNDEVWQKVKDGEVKGFSIEGYFVDKYDMSSHEDELLIEKLKDLINKYENTNEK
jgi:phage head maturation protease